MNATSAPPELPDPRRIIVLDASPTGENVGARVGAIEKNTKNDLSLAASANQAGHEGIGALPVMLETCLKEAGWINPDLIAVIVGPGSFTGLRTACALAAGLAFGAECPVVGVTRGEALASRLNEQVTARKLNGWLCVYGARRGRWFVESVAGDVIAVESATWRPASAAWLLAGDAATDCAAMLSDEKCQTAPVSEADFEAIAGVALARLKGALPPRSALPLYVDPPEAKLPRAGLRARPQ
ncbi:tRNA (adenosine(37)-N6)-threonylcarbamoyltransferase complex dimerization subunit type 1 TsaB [Acetobacter oeni]|uniref:Gcp-like domain-containing protein n=1 Tax=Acetobacter oeni TaxID=304077 RepID=A0A511XLV9_9PROT|nr:tRNA (adenosine(37)-N6)-threonylcarbamoyltransferase complex dimerization subunit type 1 TsaB [Acetobacter oeni]MBB3882962.1 tRNA threonylcarbamoyl adenosine modification protein YeaZ [Acetobacter oeni]NHO19042.1 tRNA (adenosine(37)-N6)-threonylcarbamoyltransferase complex dimerization subunit type 1 TsaB [Acetobacter oeni]GBR09253.1 peptidase [Acetobacter oeni LMG 21952]GEN63918.1 hypothetical protein AOE01nite_21420 [Acetobacter oeni]